MENKIYEKAHPLNKIWDFWQEIAQALGQIQLGWNFMSAWLFILNTLKRLNPIYFGRSSKTFFKYIWFKFFLTGFSGLWKVFWNLS